MMDIRVSWLESKIMYGGVGKEVDNQDKTRMNLLKLKQELKLKEEEGGGILPLTLLCFAMSISI